MSNAFWQNVDRQLTLLRTAKSASEVVDILGTDSELSTAPAFFGGSGGDGTVRESLVTAGWQIVWSQASYYWAAQAPDGSHVTYIEGDIYPELRR